MENNVIIKKANCHGKGVFANRDFKKGEILFFDRGDLYNINEYPFLIDESLYDYENDRYVQVSETEFLGPYKDGSDADLSAPGYWVNHSCDPNCLVQVQKNKNLKIFARRNIKKNEEITYDYSLTMLDSSWDCLCKCGSPKCRTKIVEFLKLPEKTQESYIKEKGVPQYIIQRLKLKQAPLSLTKQFPQHQ